jgi:predicted secreted protein
MTEAVLQAPVVEGRAEPIAAAATEDPTATKAEEEAPAEAGLVDIASILGALTMTVVQLSL